MGAIDGVPLLLQSAEATARSCELQFEEIVDLMERVGAQTTFVNGLRTTTVQLELTIIGVFSLFEARMRCHVPQGSFFRTLQTKLVEAEQGELAERVHIYYLAINVLKHGEGPSYKALLDISDLPFEIKRPGKFYFDEGDISESEALINIMASGFFKGLIQTLEEAYQFLSSS